MLAALGPFRFDVTGLPAHEIGRETSGRWPSHDVVGTAPVLEFVGPGTDEVTINADLFPSDLHPTGPAQLAALRAAVRAGSTFMFVMANGDVIGRVAVEKVRETGTHFRKINGAQKISVAITLKATGSRTGGGLGMLFTLF
jgi:hypothetical protein